MLDPVDFVGLYRQTWTASCTQAAQVKPTKRRCVLALMVRRENRSDQLVAQVMMNSRCAARSASVPRRQRIGRCRAAFRRIRLRAAQASAASINCDCWPRSDRCRPRPEVPRPAMRHAWWTGCRSHGVSRGHRAGSKRPDAFVAPAKRVDQPIAAIGGVNAVNSALMKPISNDALWYQRRIGDEFQKILDHMGK